MMPYEMQSLKTYLPKEILSSLVSRMEIKTTSGSGEYNKFKYNVIGEEK